MSPCPSYRQLAAYAHGMFDEPTCALMAAHLHGCEDCLARVERLDAFRREENGDPTGTRPDAAEYPRPLCRPESQLTPVAQGRSWLRRRPVLGVLAAAAAMLFVGLSIGSTLLAFRLLDERATLLDASARRLLEADLAIDSINGMLDEIGGRRVERPASIDVRTRRILEAVSTYYNELANGDTNEPSIRAANVAIRNGMIHFWLGNDAEARRAIELAAGQLDTLIAQEPENEQYRLADANRLILTANVMAVRQEHHSANAEFKRAAQIVDQFGHAQIPEWQFASLQCKRGMASAMHEMNLGGALALMAEASNGLEVLVVTDPEQIDYQFELSGALMELGRMQVSAGNTAHACQNYLASISVQRRVVQAHPHPVEILRLARALSLLGNLYVNHNSPEGADTLDQCVKVLEILNTRHPNSRMFQRELADGHVALAACLKSVRVDEAATNYRRAINIYENLLIQTPDDPDTRGRLDSINSELAILADAKSN